MRSKAALAVILLLAGCQTVPTPVPGEIVAPPAPPEAPALARQSLRAKGLSVPDRYILIRWDASAGASSYLVQWSPQEAPETVSQAETTQPQQNIVSLFKSRGVAPGWYVVRVTAVNGIFLESQPVTATILLWKP